MYLSTYILGASNRENISHSMAQKNASYSLLLPGKILNLTALNNLRKFRERGNKTGAIESWKLLDEAGLGTVIESKARRGTDMVCTYIRS